MQYFKYIGLLILLAISGSVNAIVIVDRGLPTDNLNNAAGASRSDVAWAFANPDYLGEYQV